jgi:peptide/nickel transport system substrate-binding protein
MPQKIDDLTYRVKIKKGIKFHDGSELKATDVKFTYDTILDPKFGSLFLKILDYIDSVSVLDDYQVEFKFKKPVSLTSHLLRNTVIGIVPKAVVEKMGVDFGRLPVGTGPFKITKFIDMQLVDLVRFDNYWNSGPEKKPFLDAATENIITEDATRVSALKAGDMDIIYLVPPRDFKVLPTADIVPVQNRSRFTYFMTFNCSKKPEGKMGSSGHENPFYDPLLRKAVWYGIDKEEIIRTIFEGYAEPSVSFLAPIDPYYNPKAKAYPYDPNMAKQLLSQAGKADGFEFELQVPNLPIFQSIATMIKNYLAPLKIDVKFKIGDLEGLYEFVFDDTYEAFITYWTGGSLWIDPAVTYKWLFYGKEGGFWNWVSDAHTKADDLIDKAEVAKDEMEFRNNLMQVQEIWAEEIPMPSICVVNELWAYRKRVKNLEPVLGAEGYKALLGRLPLRDVYVQ